VVEAICFFRFVLPGGRGGRVLVPFPFLIQFGLLDILILRFRFFIATTVVSLEIGSMTSTFLCRFELDQPAGYENTYFFLNPRGGCAAPV